MKLWIFDLDGTLWDDDEPRQRFLHIAKKYFARILDKTEQEVHELLPVLRARHRTESIVLAIAKEYNLDFRTCVENTFLKIDLAQFSIPSPDYERLNALKKLSEPKIVFSNSPQVHLKRVLQYTGLIQSFRDLVGLERLNYRTKPDPETYAVIESLFPDYQHRILCDDSLHVLEVARQRGWDTIWCNPRADKVKVSGHLVIRNLAELPLVVKN